MRGFRGIGMLSLAAASVALAVAPMAAAAPVPTQQRANTRKPVKQRRARYYPELNRAKRHPPAESYREGADISTALGLRSLPLR